MRYLIATLVLSVIALSASSASADPLRVCLENGTNRAANVRVSALTREGEFGAQRATFAVRAREAQCVDAALPELGVTVSFRGAPISDPYSIRGEHVCFQDSASRALDGVIWLRVAELQNSGRALTCYNHHELEGEVLVVE